LLEGKYWTPAAHVQTRFPTTPTGGPLGATPQGGSHVPESDSDTYWLTELVCRKNQDTNIPRH